MSARLDGIAMLGPLRIRDFRLLWTGMMVSLLGDGVFYVAIAWQVYELSDAPTALSVVGLGMSLSQVVFLLLGGVASDRFDRRRVMLVADLLRAMVLGVLGLLALVGALELWHMVVLATLYGTGAGFFGPAFDAIVPDLVPDDLLAQANSLDQVLRPIALRMAGPAIGGWLIAASGTGGAFLLDAGSFLVSAAMLALMSPRRIGEAPDKASTSALREMREGFDFVRHHVWLWGTFVAATFAYLLFVGPTEVLVPFLVKNDLGGSARDLGLIFSVGGLGAVAGAFVVGQRGLPRRYISFMYLCWSAATLAVAGYGLATRSWHAMLAGLAFNALEAAGTVVWATTKHRLVPAALLGRVSSFDWFISIGLLPVSFAITGPVAEAVGARTTLVAAGVLGAAVTLGFLFVPGMRAIERGESASGSPPDMMLGASIVAGDTAVEMDSQAGREGVEQALLALLERLNQGFLRRDVERVLDLFVPDAELVFIGSEDGETATGATQLRSLLETLFARPETYRWSWDQLRFRVNDSVAWLATEAVLTVEGPERLELPYRMTLTLERRRGRWLIMHYHGSEPAANSDVIVGSSPVISSHQQPSS